MSTDHNLRPLLVDAETGEPYLRRSPQTLDNVTITPLGALTQKLSQEFLLVLGGR